MVALPTPKGTMQVVEEFEPDYGTDDDAEVAAAEDGATAGGKQDGGKEGKLASFFKGLFKGEKASKDKVKKLTASSSRGASSTQNAGTTPTSPTASGPAQAAEQLATGYQDGSATHVAPRSKSSIAVSPGAGSRLGKPPSPKGADAEAVAQRGPRESSEPATPPVGARSKSVLLKDELTRLRGSPMQHSKSFTELSLKAKVVQRRGNEVLIMSPAVPPRMQRTEWSLKDYAVVEKMYKGYASSVYKAFCKRSGELVCLKAYDMAALCELNRFQIYREVQLHGKLSHHNIIGLYGAFQVDSQVVMVQEFADGGDLFTLLHRYGGRMPERQAVDSVLLPCLRVLVYLHEQGILHRDIKPENILFTRNMTFKLCDFGLAIDLRDERAVTRAGTLEYMAPEVLECPFKSRPVDNKDNERLHYSAAVDAWAVGVLAYELLVGRPPFEAPEREGMEDCIRKQNPRYPFGLSELARAFIAWALQKDPQQRPTVAEMLAHPFIRGARPDPAAQQQQRPPSQTHRPHPPAAVVTAGGAGHQQVLPSASATATTSPRVAAAAAAAGSAAAAGGLASPPAAKSGHKAVGSRAIAAAGGMDDDDLNINSMTNRMKSYTAGKAIAISHQALQANRHVHLPYAGQNEAAKEAAAAARAAVGATNVAPMSPAALRPTPPPEPQMPGSRLAALNPKLAATLSGNAGGAGLVGRTVSVSRLM